METYTPGRIKLLQFGRIGVYKNIPFSVKLTHCVPDAELIVAGEGHIPAELERHIREERRVTLLNQFIDARLQDLLFKWCDFLLLPYTDATQSGLVALAGRYGVPSLVSDIQAFRPHIETSNAILLPTDCVDAAADVIRSLPTRHTEDYSIFSERAREAYCAAERGWQQYISLFSAPNGAESTSRE
jgi:glycosyltransferase involved in cell wall biosynthesis